MTPLLEFVLGANWRTTLSGLVETAIAALIAVQALPADAWRDPHVWIPAVGLAIAKTLRDINTKDHKVSGNGTAASPTTVNDGSLLGRSVAPIILLFLLPCFLFSGCGAVSVADQEYRRAVESQDFGVAGTYDVEKKLASGEVKTSVHFRNPDEGLRK